MRVLGSRFWCEVGVCALCVVLAALTAWSPGWRSAIFGSRPSDAVLGPVIAVLLQAAVLAAGLAAREGWRGGGGADDRERPRAPREAGAAGDPESDPVPAPGRSTPYSYSEW